MPAPPPYRRRLLLQRGDAELLLVRWAPHGASAIHDHGGGYGYVWVLHGTLREQRWESAAAAQAGEAPSSRDARPGRLLHVGPEVVHRMLNRDGAPAWTLHAYRGVRGPMRILDLERLRTLFVPPDHGAWLPSAAGTLRVQPWA